MTSPAHDSFEASKEVVEWLGEIPTPSTRKTYCSALFNYWQNSVSKDYPTLADWIETVKKERGSKNMMVRKAWARQVLSYMDSFVSSITHRGMSTDYKSVLSNAVKSFLRAHVDEDLDYDFKLKETVQEIDDSENKPAITVEEMRRIYESAKTSRDKALVLVAVNGVAPAEMIQFCETWKKWFNTNMTAPFRVNLVRGKARFAYHTTLWQDAVEALKALYAERMRETGGQVDALFTTDTGEPFTRAAYNLMWEHLREREQDFTSLR